MSGATQQDDLEMVNLEKEIEDMARDLVKRVGGYPPFGAIIDDAGHVTVLMDEVAVNGGATADTGNKVLAMVRKEASPANIRAAGVANLGYMKDEKTGISNTAMVLSLHHRSGRCIDFAIPFSKAASGEPRFGETVVGLGRTKIFE